MGEEASIWSKVDMKVDKELDLEFEQIKDLKLAFDYFDEKGAGIITAKYLKIAMRALGYEPSPKEMKKLESEIELKQKGKLCFQDFLDIMKKKMTERDDEHRIIQSFSALSGSNENGITLEDLKEVADLLDCEMNEEELQEMIEEGDYAMNGYVNIVDYAMLVDRFYTIQSKDVKWCYKYPKNFNYYAVCAQKFRDSELDDDRSPGSSETRVSILSSERESSVKGSSRSQEPEERKSSKSLIPMLKPRKSDDISEGTERGSKDESKTLKGADKPAKMSVREMKAKKDAEDTPSIDILIENN